MKIKLLIMDVDGTLTDGHIYMCSQGEAMKAFHVQDGYGIAQLLPKHSIVPAIITGRESEIVRRRCEELKIIELYQGISDKLSCLESLADSLHLAMDEVAYIGDDLNDLACIRHCGLTACPADAVDIVRAEVDYICNRDGGRGAVREFIDWMVETNKV